MTLVLRTARDLGALIRDRRKKLALDQETLAKRVGVSRQWIVAVEKGKPRAEVGLVLRTLATLGVRLVTDDAEAQHVEGPPSIDLDAIIARARQPTRPRS